MYQQQQHPIDDVLREHIHGIPTPAPRPAPIKKVRPKRILKQKKQKQKTGKYGYTYNRDGSYQ